MKLLFAFMLAVVLYLIQYFLYNRLWDKKLYITIDFAETVVEEGSRTTLIETIENRKWMPLPILQIKFATTRTFLFAKEKNASVTDQYYRNEFFSVMPHQRIIRELPFVCEKRGCYRVNGMDVLSRDLFLTEKMFLHMEHEATIYVLPRRIQAEKLSVSMDTLFGNIVKKSYINEDPFEFAGIREYQPYDNMHSINWKDTAKMGALQVNTYNTTFSQEIHIFLNLETQIVAHANKLQEESIRIADAVANWFLFQKIPVGFYTNAKDLYTKEEFVAKAGAGNNHIRNIEIAMARIDLTQAKVNFSELLYAKSVAMNKNVKLVVISNYRKTDMVNIYNLLRDGGFSCSWIIPEFFDIEINEMCMGLPEIKRWEVTYGD